jgi:hypothetical protein
LKQGEIGRVDFRHPDVNAISLRTFGDVAAEASKLTVYG